MRGLLSIFHQICTVPQNLSFPHIIKKTTLLIESLCHTVSLFCPKQNSFSNFHLAKRCHHRQGINFTFHEMVANSGFSPFFELLTSPRLFLRLNHSYCRICFKIMYKDHSHESVHYKRGDIINIKKQD